MHPNAFLRTFWQLECRPQIFVAMSYAGAYDKRYKDVIEPAITSIPWRGTYLRSNRVDNSKTGDSILTDIVDGIAHCQLVLADVSTVGNDNKTGERYRNANVMYEIGIALACRQPCDVLLIRDDRDKFLFDVSTVPHKQIDFTDPATAKQVLREELIGRLKEQTYLNDARVQLALASLSDTEIELLSIYADLPEGQLQGVQAKGLARNMRDATMSRLLDKRLIALAGMFDVGAAAYQATQLGRVVAELARAAPKLKGTLESKDAAAATDVAPP